MKELHLPPLPAHHEMFLRDLTPVGPKKLILAEEQVGPLTVFFYEHPIWTALIGASALGAFLAGCWTCIQI